MPTILNRPPVRSRQGCGLLSYEHFQIGYVTSDLARACDAFRDRYGIGRFQVGSAELPDGRGLIDVALAWAGGR